MEAIGTQPDKKNAMSHKSKIFPFNQLAFCGGHKVFYTVSYTQQRK
jgi:hypothetical protein